MIRYGTLLRLSDGAPLSATTDVDVNANVNAARKLIKSISTRIVSLPNRVCIQDDELTVHCIHDSVVGILAVCDPSYSHLLVYSFLDDLSKEFNALYTASVVAAVRRPYAFIEYDGFLEKTRQKYNSPRYVAGRVNLTELRNDLTMRPPVVMLPSDLKPLPTPGHSRQSSSSLHTSLDMPNGAIPNGHVVDDVPVGISAELMPVPMFGRIVGVFTLLLAALDAYRTIAALSNTSYEILFLRKYYRHRKLLSVCCVTVILLLSVVLLNAVREAWICIVYVSVSVILAFFTLTRNFKKLNRFNV